MLNSDLFNAVLIKPAKKGCNKLYIVSGYGTAAMASHHLSKLKEERLKVNIELILGMCSKDGLAESDHRGFKRLMEKDFKGVFKCSYVVEHPPVHSKVYIWFKDDKPMFGFAGSVNYTQTGFSVFKSGQREALVEHPPEDCFEYYESLYADTIYCNHIDVENNIRIYKDLTYNRLLRQKIIQEDELREDLALQGLPHVRLSLLGSKNMMYPKSGLNWGQRNGRNKNQAYIAVPIDVHRMGFFPEDAHFTVYTDDDMVLICTRAQQNKKAIQTPNDNSQMGMYFRNRLGLRPGIPVTKKHLLNYGRTHVDFYKIDEGTYYMDFSVK